MVVANRRSLDRMASATNTPLPTVYAGAQADVRGTLSAVHFRDERGFAIFSLEQPDGSRVRARGYVPPEVTLRAVVRIGGTWTQHAQYGWQIQVRTVELIDHLDRRGVVAFLVAYTTHLGPVRASEAVERFGDRVFEVIREQPEDLCVIKGITPERARAVHDSFATVSAIANVDSWLRHIGLGKADARQVREAYGDDAARLHDDDRTGAAVRWLRKAHVAKHFGVEKPTQKLRSFFSRWSIQFSAEYYESKERQASGIPSSNSSK